LISGGQTWQNNVLNATACDRFTSSTPSWHNNAIMAEQIYFILADQLVQTGFMMAAVYCGNTFWLLTGL
jgi:hypothetical protein